MIIKVSPYIAERVARKRQDFRIEYFRAGGKGGMNQNKVSSACRITDLKTGLATDCREERDQPQNRKKAFLRLAEKLIEHYRQEEIAQRITEKELSRAVRTYNVQRNKVHDHRTGKEYALDQILNGRLDQMIKDGQEALNECVSKE